MVTNSPEEMPWSPSSLLALSLCSSVVVADYLGATYPSPRDLTSNSSLFASAWANLSTTLDSFLVDGENTGLATLAGLENITFSLGAFSIHDPAAADLQYHYTSPEISNGPNGTRRVDGDSIYRGASITKLLTVYTALLALEPTDWDRSLGELFPDVLAQSSGGQDSVDAVNWNTVTVAALAAQLAGVPHDGAYLSGGDRLWSWITALALGTEASAIDPATLGLPPLDPTTDTTLVAPCLLVGDPNCPPASSYLESVRAQPPAFQPWTSPGYSNNGFILLGIAIANITGMPIEQLYLDTVFGPLGMTDSNTLRPNVSDYDQYVIPGGIAVSDINTTAGVTVSSGGIFTTINDLAKFGSAILNSTQLSPEQTRRWMKPVTHTANLKYAVGSPWEIYRYTSPASGKIIDIYTKQGDSGLFVTYLILLPDFGVGFSVLSGSTSPDRSELIPILTDLMIETVLPALESQTAVEAAANFAGTYTSTTEGLNSSLTLSYNSTSAPSFPGLTVTSWTSNGTTLTPAQLTSILGSETALLVQSIPESNDQRVAFRASTQNGRPDAEAQAAGLFWGQYTRNLDWLAVDARTYGGKGLSLLVFDVDGEGRATAVTPAAFRVTLRREG